MDYMVGRQAITHKKMNTIQKSVFYSFLVTVAVVLIAFGGFVPKSVSSPDQNTGYSQTNIGEFSEGIKNGDLAERWISKTMISGTNSVALYTNRSGRDAYVYVASVNVPTGQTASSTSNVFLFATTSTSIGVAQDFVGLGGTSGKAFLINGVTIATTSTATTTSSVYAAVAQKGNGAIVVPDGSTVFGYLQQNTTLANSACSALGLCETATSTNRGFNPVFNIKVYATP